MRLGVEERAAAPKIYQALMHSKRLAATRNVVEVSAFVCALLAAEPLLNVEYFEIVHPVTLTTLDSWSDADAPVGCIAVYCGGVRLIDNIIYNK